MLETSIRHGDLVIDFNGDKHVQIVRQSNGNAVRLSMSEWVFIQQIAVIQGWPMAPPLQPDPQAH